jgi:dihydroorotate dehydrogenase
VEQAGASAIELNPYFIPADPSRTVLDVEGTYLAVIQAVKASVSVPIAMKLSPYFSAIAAMATALARAGADGLVVVGALQRRREQRHLARLVRRGEISPASAGERIHPDWVSRGGRSID